VFPALRCSEDRGDWNWFCETPVELILADGIVVGMAHSDNGRDVGEKTR
jgi:hypothetical protein